MIDEERERERSIPSLLTPKRKKEKDKKMGQLILVSKTEPFTSTLPLSVHPPNMKLFATQLSTILIPVYVFALTTFD